MIESPDRGSANSHKAPFEAKPVIVISSHVMAGAVGNRAAAFTLERLGFPVWEVPTVILPWHPGHGPGTVQRINPELFAKSLEDLSRHPDFASVSAIYSGYLGSLEQVGAIASLVDRYKSLNPAGIFFCDPVIGDKEGLYMAEDIAIAIRDHLIPRADIISPNRFELNWLTASAEENNNGLIEQARKLGRKTTMITSAFALMRNAIANLLIHEEETGKTTLPIMCEHPAIPNPQNGTGDMMASLFLGHKLASASDETALKQASSGVLEVVTRSANLGYRDLEIARFADRFHSPMAMVNMRQIGVGPKLTTIRKAPRKPRPLD
ncbi:pyridoxal kinase [uncultured Cohaesibacter sp.]|uniref:pyridoxal kinase n=1 Tax=uncultured Cohaesibacter sp. TaxID=1002546 RepID=UPI0029C82FE7|nr:pyridoxal kinase [uncultured Cohaesibacter sp.]